MPQKRSKGVFKGRACSNPPTANFFLQKTFVVNKKIIYSKLNYNEAPPPTFSEDIKIRVKIWKVTEKTKLWKLYATSPRIRIFITFNCKVQVSLFDHLLSAIRPSVFLYLCPSVSLSVNFSIFFYVFSRNTWPNLTKLDTNNLYDKVILNLK